MILSRSLPDKHGGSYRNMKKFLLSIPDIILAQIAAFSLTYALTSSLMLDYSPYRLLLMIVISVLLLYSVFINKKTIIAGAIILGLSAAAGIVYVSFYIGLRKVITFASGYYYYIKGFIEKPVIIVPIYQFITALFLCIAFSVFMYFFIVKKFKFFIAISAGILIFTIQWCTGILTSMLSFYLFLCVFLLCYIKKVYSYKAGTANEYLVDKTVMLWSFPLCLIIIVFAFSFKASDKPITIPWLDDKVISVYNYFTNNYQYASFDYFSIANSSGFGDSGALGGRVRLDDTEVLKVSTHSNVYLKGSVRDVYTGTSWEYSTDDMSEIGQDFSELYDDVSTLKEGINILEGDNADFYNYFERYDVSVTYLNLKTKTLFLPEFVMSLNINNKNFTGLIGDTGDISAEKRLSKDFTYSFGAYAPIYGNDQFDELMRKSSKGIYKKLASRYAEDLEEKLLRHVFSKYDINAILTDRSILKSQVINGRTLPSEVISDLQKYYDVTDLKNYCDVIDQKYLQLPEDLPQRVKDLSETLTADCSTDYDKAKAIEKYLSSSNFKYNLDINSTPKNRDFVDYFLFDQGEGYCTYFASAMTILARCAGLPARYVEGYILPPEPAKDYGNTYIVTNEQAHAWVEIYFEGLGWIPFEPTSPFRSKFYASSSTEDVTYTGQFSPQYQDYMEMMAMYGNMTPSFPTGLSPVGDKKNIKVETVLAVAALIIVAAFMLLILINGVRKRFKLYKLFNLPAKQCVLKLYNYYVSALSLEGIRYAADETPLQYSQRVDEIFLFNSANFGTITDVFIRARYSSKTPTDDDKKLLCDFYETFIKELKKSMGKCKFFFLSSILYRF
jgi:transglutaminase-like putative cysteine protease